VAAREDELKTDYRLTDVGVCRQSAGLQTRQRVSDHLWQREEREPRSRAVRPRPGPGRTATDSAGEVSAGRGAPGIPGRRGAKSAIEPLPSNRFMPVCATVWS